MAGFRVGETFSQPPAAVWAYLTDFRRAGSWMNGIEGMDQVGEGALEVGTRFRFESRGKQRETVVSALEQGRSIALTSVQGGVSATYRYDLSPKGDGTEVTLDAVCEAAGVWRLIHPLIAFAMKKSDSSQLANLKAAMEQAQEV